MRLIVSGKRSAEKPRIMRDHRFPLSSTTLIQRSSRKTKSPGPTPGAFVSLKQLAYLEMKSQSSSEDMEIQLSIDGGMRLERSAPDARVILSKQLRDCTSNRRAFAE